MIGSTGITYNQARLNETCQYLYDKDLSFIIYTEHRFQPQWFEDAKNRWGSHFLGYYVFDEPGGRQLDRSHMMVQSEAENYTDAANQFVNDYNTILNNWKVILIIQILLFLLQTTHFTGLITKQAMT